MKKIKLAFVGLFLLVTVAWLLADTLLPEPLTYFTFRGVFVQYSGVVAIAMMSVAMLLSVRPRWLERPFGGLDKMYRLHKWLGIGGLVFAVLHWWWAKGTKWMVGWGWLSRPAKQTRTRGDLTQFEHWLRGQRELAESLGEWAFYLIAILIAVALIKLIPYHWFRKTHRWIAPIYLVLAYHSAILAKPEYWLQPIGWLVAVLLVVGSVSALLSLSGRIGRGSRVGGEIKSLTTYPGVNVIEGSILLNEGWRGHEPGQFAFVTSSHREGAHPYTIASAWDDSTRRLTFIVKALGDWTGHLGDRLKEGMPVTVEGPYGSFDFRDRCPRQIWVGAGIGITPFVAKMKHLARHPGDKQIDLFHVTRDYDQTAIDKLTADAAAAGVRLHLMVTPRDGRLTPERIRELVPEWRSASLWFCGPTAFGTALCQDFLKQGLPVRHFHQEQFELR